MTGEPAAGTAGGRSETLRDGRRLWLRRMLPDDGGRLERFWQRLQPAAQRRFLELADVSERAIPSATTGPADLIAGVVATPGPSDPTILGIARYRRIAGDGAEFLVFVDAAVRGIGLGTALVRQLARLACRSGIRTITGDVRVGETGMVNLLEDVGLTYRRRDRGDRIQASFDVDETDRFLDAVLRDRATAARATLDRFLRPSAIAVVGAGADRDSIGGLLFANLLGSDFGGAVIPVNPNRTTVQGVIAYPDLRSCPIVPELAIVCVPAPAVAGVVTDAGAVGVRAVCVISSGFAETGVDGARLQAQLAEVAGSAGLRIVGPNCMGILNGLAGTRFNGTFSRSFPPPGRVSLLTQSGAVGLAALEQSGMHSLGIGGFVSVGNSIDVAGNDLVLYWGDDPDTEVILLYLESVQDPRWFARIARRVASGKPIVAVKAGRTTAGRRAAASHTAALASGEVAVDALFRQAGVIRTDTIEEMFEAATILTARPLPPGRRVAIVTNGGGPGILAADACEAHGLVVPELSSATQSALRAFLPSEAGVGNPVDMIASATAEQYGQALRVLGAASEVDAIIAMFIPPILTRAVDVAEQLVAARIELHDDVALVAVFMNRDGAPPLLAGAGIPSFAFPENAARALGRVAAWEQWRRRPAGHVLRPDVDAGKARPRVAAALTRADPAWLDTAEAQALLDIYGIPTARMELVTEPAHAADAQRRLAGTVVVKIAAAVHKSDLGGVRTGITTPEGAAAALQEIRGNLEASGLGELAEAFVVQEQIGGGREMIVGVNHDPDFGPLVMVGLGGGLVELLGDIAVRITPLTDVDVDDMLRSLRSYPLLSGYRGQPALDIDALRDVLHRVSAMVEDLPEIVELDLNPVFVGRHGAVAADVRIKVATPAASPL